MAEARSAVSELRVPPDLQEGRSTWKDFLQASRKNTVRRYYRTRNSIRNGTWPTSTSNLAAVFLVSVLFLLSDAPPSASRFGAAAWKVALFLNLPSGLPLWLKASVVAWVVSVTFFVVIMKVRQYVLRILLSYKGWLFERSVQRRTVVWAVLVRLISGYLPSLYSCQRSLPRLSVPPVRSTIAKLLESLKPLCTPEELRELQLQAKDFESHLGAKLQRVLVLKSWWAPNYVSDWWEKYVYLMARNPLAINSNFYGFDHSYWQPTTNQAARAGNVLHDVLVFKRKIDWEELPPLVLRHTIPICMAQYERIFSTTRIPGEDHDELLHYDSTESKHVVVISNGLYYKLDVYDHRNQILVPAILEDQINWILNDSKKNAVHVTEESRILSALTALPRTDWAKVRKEYFSSGINKETMEHIEKAICMVVLTPESFTTLTERAKWLLHGDGRSLWFDKCFSMVFFDDGKCGLHVEHTMADAPIVGHVWEYAMTREVVERLYTAEGNCMPPTRPFRQGKFKPPVHLQWELEPELEKSVRYAFNFAQKNNADLHLEVFDHCDWGKGVIKKCKVSPDAFIQLALQLAYYKDAKKFAQTYEASMTRLFLSGRTETVRSCTQEASDFVLSMIEDGHSREEKVKLLRRAADKHQLLYREAMTGSGIDRHLFALYVCCRGLGHSSPFLESVLSRPWTLSTSQQPHQQLSVYPDCNLETFKDMVSPGGGFGPVSDDGYGVSYMLPSDHKIFFHVSSKHSSQMTDSKRFIGNLVSSLAEMKRLFELDK